MEDGRFKKVSIRAEDGSLGCMHVPPARGRFLPDGHLDLRGRLRLEQEAVSTQAGYWAERRWTRRRPGRRDDWLAHLEEGAQPDLHRTVDLADFANGGVDSVSDAWLKWVDERAKSQLAIHWDLVNLVADELLERKELPWEQFLMVVERSTSM